MKKIRFIIIVFTILSLVGCANNQELETLKKENQKLKEQIAEITKNNVTSNNQETTDNNRGMEAIDIGQNLQVNTEFGDFEIQIDSVKDINMLDDNSKVVVINCVVNNISFSASRIDKDVITGILIADDNNILQLTDNEGIAFSFYNLSAPNGTYALDHRLSIGDKGYEAYAFLVPTDVKRVSVVINKQYILHTDIQK